MFACFRTYRDAGLSYMFNIDFFHLPSQMRTSDGVEHNAGDGTEGRARYVVDATYVLAV